MVLGNGFDIDLGLNTTFKAFRESFEFRSIADIPLIKKIRDNQWNDIEGKLREELMSIQKIQVKNLPNPSTMLGL